MAQDLLTLYNLALSSIGSRGVKLSSPTERSREAEECNLWFPQVRDQVLRAGWWPCARAVARLAHAQERDEMRPWEPGDPQPGWHYTFALPIDYLYPRHLTGYEWFETGVAALDGINDVPVLYASVQRPILVYTKKQENLSVWDSQLFSAVAAALAAAIALPLTGKPTWKREAEERANRLILEARAASLNETPIEEDSVPSWIAARGYAGNGRTRRYIYPYGPLLGESAGGGNVY